jgi:hypothetical protein
MKGQLCLFDNKGKAIKLSGTVTATLFEYVSNTDSLTLNFNMFDSTGIIAKLTLDSLYNPIGEPKVISQFEPFTKVIVQNDPVTNKTFFLTQTQNSWALYGPDLKKITSKIYTDSTPQYNYFTLDGVGKVMLANFQKQQSEYYWYNMNGELYIDFPIKGSTPFNTANLMMDRGNYLIGGDLQNNIFAYKLK